jgi:hypothetical protein
LALYNDFTDKLFTRSNISIVYSYQPLLSLVDGGCDPGHYTEYTAMMPIFQQLLQVLVDVHA